MLNNIEKLGRLDEYGKRTCSVLELQRFLGLTKKYEINAAISREDLEAIKISRGSRSEFQIPVEGKNVEWIETFQNGHISKSNSDEPDKPDNALLKAAKKLLPPELIGLVKDTKSLISLYTIHDKSTKTGIERGEYVARETVKHFLDQIISIDNSLIKPLGQSVAKDIALKCEVNDPRKVLEIQEMIDKVVYTALDQRKKKISQWLIKRSAIVSKAENEAK